MRGKVVVGFERSRLVFEREKSELVDAKDLDQASNLVLPTAQLSPPWTPLSSTQAPAADTITTRAVVDRTAQLLSGAAPRSIFPQNAQVP